VCFLSNGVGPKKRLWFMVYCMCNIQLFDLVNTLMFFCSMPGIKGN